MPAELYLYTFRNTASDERSCAATTLSEAIEKLWPGCAFDQLYFFPSRYNKHIHFSVVTVQRRAYHVIWQAYANCVPLENNSK